MTFCHHLRLIGNSVGDRKAIELWQKIEYKILNTKALPPWLEINLQPLGLWKHTNDLKTSDDLEKGLRQKLDNGCTSSIKTRFFQNNSKKKNYMQFLNHWISFSFNALSWGVIQILFLQFATTEGLSKAVQRYHN